MDDFSTGSDHDDPARLYAELDRPLSAPGDAQRRGRSLERLLRLVLDREGLEPTSSFRPMGEEVDGAFTLHNRTYLFEAKWQKDSIPASAIYAFKGKVDGKLVGTIGVFFSMSDYSKDAVNALVSGKELNIILFNKNDFRVVANGQIPFVEAMKSKLRHAAERGGPLLPLEEEEIITTVPSGDRRRVQPRGAAPRSFHFVVEGRSDHLAFEAMFKRLNLRGVLDLHFWVAGGKLNVPPLALKLSELPTAERVVAVIDEDHPDSAANERIRESLRGTQVTLLVLRPDLETWLLGGFPERGAVPAIGRANRREFARDLAEDVDIEELRRLDQTFDALMRELLGGD